MLPRMPQFPSDEWTSELIEQFLAHPDAADAAARLAGRYRLVVEPDDGFDDRHVTTLEVGVDDDSEPHMRMVDADPDLSVTASYRRWKAMVRREQSLTRAVATGRVRIGGSKREALRKAGSMGPLLQAMAKVDTVWPDESG